MNAQPVALADRILAALAEKPRTEVALRAVFPRVHPDALHIKLVELQRAGRAVSVENAWRLAPGTNAAESVERVQAAANVVKRDPLPPPPLDPGPIVLPKLRKCTQCGEEKPLTEFHRQPLGTDGHRADCKCCVRIRQRKRQAEKRVRSEAAVERLRPEPVPAVAETQASELTPPAASEPAPTSTILQFPAPPREPPKTLEEVVNRQRAVGRITKLHRIVINDSEVGPQAMVLSDEGIRALREQLATL